MKTISIFLSLINSLLAGVILLASLSDRELYDATVIWSITKTFTSGTVIVSGVLTWLGILNSIKPGWVAMSNIGLIMLGTATVVWTFHLATLSGDMEYYMAVYGFSLMVQGMASLFGLAEESNNWILRQ
jgi:hypothetical protein